MNICSSAGKCGNLLEQKSGKPVKHLYISLYQSILVLIDSIIF